MDSHKGDAVIYVEIGPITFYLPDSAETLVVEEGEAAFLPAGTKYHCINYTKHNVKGIFMIAPDM
jgi:quercetin dioxygenase-like cupin family protein